MEERLRNKKQIIVAFIIMISFFLFIYKGLFQSGEYYKLKYDEYISIIKSKGQPSTALKKPKITEKTNNSTNKMKIPPELLNMDNSLLESKSLLSGIKDKNEKVESYLKQLLINKNLKAESIEKIITKCIKQIKAEQDGLEAIDKNIEGVVNEIEKLRNKIEEEKIDKS